MKSCIVAEDAPAMLKWLVDHLRRLPGIQNVLGVANAVEVLDAFAAAKPDVLLLDLALPERPDEMLADPNTGLSLIDRFRSASDRPGIIALSSFDLGAEAVQRGADAFVPKSSPNLWRDIEAAVRECLAGAERP